MISPEDQLPVHLLALCWEAQGSPYTAYPVIREQTPADLDWYSTRDNSEISALIDLCMHRPYTRRGSGLLPNGGRDPRYWRRSENGRWMRR